MGGAGCASDPTISNKFKKTDNENRYRLFQTFKIKALGVGSNHNLFSDKSLTKVCTRSRHSLEDLAIKNAIHLTNANLAENLSLL